MDTNSRKKTPTPRDDATRMEYKEVRYVNRKVVLKAVKKSLPAAKESLEYLKNR